MYVRSMPHEPVDDHDRPNVLRFALSPKTIALDSTSTVRATRSTSSRRRRATRYRPQELPPHGLLPKEIAAGDATLSVRGAEELWRITTQLAAATFRCRRAGFAAGSAGVTRSRRNWPV